VFLRVPDVCYPGGIITTVPVFDCYPFRFVLQYPVWQLCHIIQPGNRFCPINVSVQYSKDGYNLGFEELENYIHPRLLELMVDIIRNAAERTQILLTTHSPYLVDLLTPEELYIVEKKEGRTQVKRAAERKKIHDALQESGLGEMWYSGSLGGVP